MSNTFKEEFTNSSEMAAKMVPKCRSLDAVLLKLYIWLVTYIMITIVHIIDTKNDEKPEHPGDRVRTSDLPIERPPP